MQIYLAGPDVFLPHADDIFRLKKEICTAAGFKAFSPFDNEIDSSANQAGAATTAHKIAAANFDLMDRCDTVIANLTPFRGPSADVGTVGEIFYMLGRGKKIWAYSNGGGDYLSRIKNPIKVQNLFFDAQGMKIEDFGLWDNLMLPEAVLRSGGAFCQAKTELPLDDLSVFKALVGKIA